MDSAEIIKTLNRRWRDTPITLREISARMGHKQGRSCVHQWLTGQKEPGVGSLVSLADALGFDVVLRDRRP